MLNKEQIIALSDKYPIDLSACIEPIRKAKETVANLDSQCVIDECENHLDEDFMDLLTKGEHLNLSFLPLSA